jgi:biopolymer transport protein ExbD
LGEPGVHRHMDLNRLRQLVAAPVACLFLILILCVFAVQRPESTGILIPMMRVRAEPLSFCEFNGFTIYLRSDGTLGGGSRDQVVSRDVMLSRIRDARDNIQDDTIFVIADPEVPYGDLASLLADIHDTAPADHIAVVTRAGQIQAWSIPGRVPLEPWADRCRFEWPATAGQPKWPKSPPIPLPGDRISVWEVLRGKRN